MTKLLAVDIGGPVIQSNRNFTLKQYAEANPTPDSFTSLEQLNTLFENNVHLISQCNEKLQEVKLKWLAEKDFCAKTNIPLERIHFVRAPKDKADLAKQLGATHFVEDRAEILNYALGVVDCLYLFNPNAIEAFQYKELLKKCRVVLNWESLFDFIKKTL